MKARSLLDVDEDVVDLGADDDVGDDGVVDGGERLAGGNDSEVVLRGGRVHRSAGPWAPATRALLGVLARAGIDEVPRDAGLDEHGNQMLTYLPGEVGHYPLPDWMWEQSVLIDAARLVRRIHDASRDLLTTDLPWQSPAISPVEVICHNDLGTYNMVFSGGRLTGIFDFDHAGPGPRLWDLAYLGYRLGPVVSDADSPTDWRARLRLLLDAYGHEASMAQLLSMMSDRVAAIERYTSAAAQRTGREDLAEHARMYRADAARIAALAASEAPSAG